MCPPPQKVVGASVKPGVPSTLVTMENAFKAAFGALPSFTCGSPITDSTKPVPLKSVGLCFNPAGTATVDCPVRSGQGRHFCQLQAGQKVVLVASTTPQARRSPRPLACKRAKHGR